MHLLVGAIRSNRKIISIIHMESRVYTITSNNKNMIMRIVLLCSSYHNCFYFIFNLCDGNYHAFVSYSVIFIDTGN